MELSSKVTATKCNTALVTVSEMKYNTLHASISIIRALLLVGTTYKCWPGYGGLGGGERIHTISPTEPLFNQEHVELPSSVYRNPLSSVPFDVVIFDQDL